MAAIDINRALVSALELSPQLQAVWGLDAALSGITALSMALVQQLGYDPPIIISGKRSPEEQLRLFKQWEAGTLRHRPATSSWHLVGRAEDVTPTEGVGFELFALLMMFFGARWGGNFVLPDRPHFDVPGPDLPPSIFSAMNHA